MIQAKNIHKYFDDLHVLKGVDLHIKQGEIVSIVGASGAGKTTLLQIIGTLNDSNGGKIKINDIDINLLKDKELAKFNIYHKKGKANDEGSIKQNEIRAEGDNKTPRPETEA